VARFLAGALACFLLMTGAFLIWQGRAARGPALSSAPAQAAAFSAFGSDQPLSAPEASPKTREERRFSRADHNKDGKIEAEEYLAGRHRYFDKLDVNHDGRLTFEEYAAKGITKFQTADQGHKGWLTPAEFATTAAPQSKHRSCSCNSSLPQAGRGTTEGGGGVNDDSE
jgi:hypothetical protein